ncbi:PQQ-dependent dehydrogenase, methanol/ethanol family [Sphingoaurantiacus capsulatus]|uniref:PQQ-dependent dehydrogenase, methanol/ethanol family n=1 Tax=Sphingoaurantiacus capsulatus TaxID=1771310 RepID=A0ABV7XCK5_9SPHN
MALLVSACGDKPAGDPFALPQGSDASDWPMHGYGYGEQRYSPLDEIDTQNVSELGLAFAFDDFVVRGRTHRGTQASPIMSDGTLYFTGPWSVVYAVDAKTGAPRWTYDPEVVGAWARHACCDAVNRGVALWKGVVYVATLDGWLVALDAKTGAVKWRVDTFTDRTKSYTITGAPRIAGDKIVIGNGGAEMGVRGYVTAYDAATGKPAWRFFTVPGEGPDEHPEVAMARKTWAPDARWDLGGGGTVWDSMTYDPALGLIYVGVGNGGPWPAWVRNKGKSPDNLFVSSILAIDAKTGRLKWHYQTTPGDSWDYTASQNMILADIEIGGKARQVLMQAPKNGFFYVLDRATGELLSAEKFTNVTWASHVDLKTGRPVLTGSADYSGAPKVVWPSTAGGHNWQPMAFSAQTGLVYIPTLEMPMTFTTQPGDVPLLPGANNTGAKSGPPNPEKDAALMKGLPPFTHQAVLKAWDPRAGKIAWQSEPMPWWSGGVLATSGGLIFSGSTEGALLVNDAKTGKLLKRIDTGLAIMAPPVTYAIDGQQYVAVLAGLGGAMNGRYMKGFAAHTYQNRERLLVFRLGGGAVDLPPAVEKPVPQPIATGLPTDPAILANGGKLYGQYCARCHSPKGAPNGYPNLWNMAPEVEANFDAVVLEGAFADAGMASFSDVLTPADTIAIRAYIAADRRAGPAPQGPAVQGGGH